jgi:hypothetical protein
VVTLIADRGSRLNRKLTDLSVNELQAVGFQEAVKPPKPWAAKTREGCRTSGDRLRLC